MSIKAYFIFLVGKWVLNFFWIVKLLKVPWHLNMSSTACVDINFDHICIHYSRLIHTSVGTWTVGSPRESLMLCRSGLPVTRPFTQWEITMDIWLQCWVGWTDRSRDFFQNPNEYFFLKLCDNALCLLMNAFFNFLLMQVPPGGQTWSLGIQGETGSKPGQKSSKTQSAMPDETNLGQINKFLQGNKAL